MSDNNTPYNASDEQAVREREKKLKLAELQMIADLREIASLPAGQRFFKEFFQLTHIEKSTYRKSADNYFMDGERNVGLRYYHRLKEHANDLLVEIKTKVIKDKEEIYG